MATDPTKESIADVTYRGGCFCGANRFTVTEPVLFSCFCHCESCQRASGGAFVGWATFRKGAFAVEAGELSLRQSSAGVTRGHCAGCGTSMTYEHAERDGEIDIALAALDNRSALRPLAHIWVEDRLPFIEISDGLPRYAKTVGSDET